MQLDIIVSRICSVRIGLQDYNVTDVPFAFETKCKHVNGFIRKLSVKTVFTSAVENESEIVMFT